MLKIEFDSKIRLAGKVKGINSSLAKIKYKCMYFYLYILYKDNFSNVLNDRDSYPKKVRLCHQLLSGAPNNSDHQAKRHQKALPPVGVTDLYNWGEIK